MMVPVELIWFNMAAMAVQTVVLIFADRRADRLERELFTLRQENRRLWQTVKELSGEGRNDT